jgi:hypothetical protein
LRCPPLIPLMTDQSKWRPRQSKNIGHVPAGADQFSESKPR